MSVADDVDLKDEKLFTIHWNLIYKCVCAPNGWDADKVGAEATRDDPPGTSANRWVVTDCESLDADHPFKNGNPQPCNDSHDRRHWIVNC